jgi:hypothetical protein
MMRLTVAASAVIVSMTLFVGPAEAKSCQDLRALCWTMRQNKNDCTVPYQRCLKTGIFVTPLGRRFRATTR